MISHWRGAKPVKSIEEATQRQGPFNSATEAHERLVGPEELAVGRQGVGRRGNQKSHENTTPRFTSNDHGKSGHRFEHVYRNRIGI